MIDDSKIVSNNDVDFGIVLETIYNDAYVLYFSVENDDQLRKVQSKIFKQLPSTKYNPDTFTFHITIDIDKEYEKIIRLRNKLKENFEPFNIVISELGLFEIYPAVKIYEC